MFTALALLASVASQAGVADVGTPSFHPATGSNPATHMAIQLCLLQVALAEKQTLLEPEHPTLARHRRRVRALEQSLQDLVDQGYPIDQQQVDGALDALLQQTKAELAVARQEWTSVHPGLALLELRLQAVASVVARRALIG